MVLTVIVHYSGARTTCWFLLQVPWGTSVATKESWPTLDHEASDDMTMVTQRNLDSQVCSPRFVPGHGTFRKTVDTKEAMARNGTQWCKCVYGLDLWKATFVTHGLTHTDIHFPSPPEATFVTVFFQCRSPLVAQGVAEMLAVHWAMKGISWETQSWAHHSSSVSSVQDKNSIEFP